MDHYHFERDHQGLDNELIEKSIDRPNMDGAVDRRERLGGIPSYYHRRPRDGGLCFRTLRALAAPRGGLRPSAGVSAALPRAT